MSSDLNNEQRPLSSPYNAAEWDLATPEGREALAVALFREVVQTYASYGYDIHMGRKDAVAHASMGWDGVQMLANALTETYRRAMQASPKEVPGDE